MHGWRELVALVARAMHAAPTTERTHTVGLRRDSGTRRPATRPTSQLGCIRSLHVDAAHATLIDLTDHGTCPHLLKPVRAGSGAT